MALPFAQPSFAKGEITPELWGHIDLAAFHTGAATARNMFIGYRGGALSRAGTKFIGVSAQTGQPSTLPPRLVAWQFNNTQSYVLEFGNLYLRFILNGAYVVSGGVPYQIATPYSDTFLFQLKFVQSADVMTIVHPNYNPMDLNRLGPANWTLTPTPIGATNTPPATVTATATVNPSPPTTLPCAYAYVVTTVDLTTGQESAASPIANVTNSVDMAATAGAIIVNWSQAPNAAFYNIYRAPTSYNTNPSSSTNALPVPVGALFGFVGSSFGNQFVDTNTTPNFSQTPPLYQNPFAPGRVLFIAITASSSNWTHATVTVSSATGSGFTGQVVIIGGQIIGVVIITGGQLYLPTDTVVFTGDGTSASATLTLSPQTGTHPSVDAYFQQRRVFAATMNQPETYWMSQPGLFASFNYSIPSQPSNALEGTPWSQKVDGIQWMLTMPLGLLTFTGSGVWQIGAQGSFASSPQAITPTTQFAAPQSSIGASSTVGPLQINWDVLYVDYNNSAVLDLAYQIFFNIYAGTDISWPSSHLLDGHQIIQWCYARTPHRIVWAVRDDGVLLSLTYLKEQEVTAWARHDTLGQVVSVCSVLEQSGPQFTGPPVDVVYVAVRRPTNAGAFYFVERMPTRLWNTIEDAWCVDAALSLPQPRPNATLLPSAATGNGVTFVAGAAVFSLANVGNVIRGGGGIAVITAFTDAQHVTGNWLTPYLAVYSDDPSNRPTTLASGAWTMTAPVTTISGFDHLDGQQIVGLADGIPIGPLTVSGAGGVTLPFAASSVTLGLGFACQLQSLPANIGQPTAQTRRKALYAITARVVGSGLMQAGANQQDASMLTPSPIAVQWPNLPSASVLNVAPQAPKPYQNAAGQTVQPLISGDVRIPISALWQKPGQAAVQQILPLPLQITMFVPETLEGDLPEVQYSPRQEARNGNGDRMKRAA